MSAEAIVYDRLESETIPVAGVEQHQQQQENLDDPNVQVPEGMERLQVVFKVKKPEEKVDEEESLGLDEAIAEDAKKATPSPNKRKVATTWEDCKAKDKATCPYHGAAFMRDKFNEIFKKYGVENAEVRIAPWVDSEGEADPSYSMYFNLPKNYDKKQLQKIFNEMMSTVKGVGELNAEDAITHHNEPEDRELTYDIESFDPNIDPNEEMAADLAKEKAQEEAKKKAEEEAAKKKAEEEAKKKAAEEEKKKAAQMKEPPKVEQGVDIKTEYPTDAADELAYLMGLMEGFNSSYVDDSTKLKATKALDNYADQMKSLATIEQKAQTTNNPETRAVLERLAKKSRETLKQKLATVEAERENYVNDIKWSMQNDLSVTETKLKAHGQMYGNGGLQDEITTLYSSLNNENRIAYHNANEELSKRIMEEKKKYDACHDLLKKYHDWVVRERDENGRLDKALNILDSKAYMDAESAYQEAADKLFVDLINNRNALQKAVEAQKENAKTKGKNPSAADVKAVVDQVSYMFKDSVQLDEFKKGLANMPLTYLKHAFSGVDFHAKGSIKRSKAWDRPYDNGICQVDIAVGEDAYRMATTLIHECGHRLQYKMGLRNGSPIPREILGFMSKLEEEGRELTQRIFANDKFRKTNNWKVHAANREVVKKFVNEELGIPYKDDRDNTESWADNGMNEQSALALRDILGCVNRGGFAAHKHSVYTDNIKRVKEAFSDCCEALAGLSPVVEKVFPKSLAILREVISNANIV